MRQTHRHNPLHRIECWTDEYFRDADLWEVGSYILGRHTSGSGSAFQAQPTCCEGLQFQIDHLERHEKIKDLSEQTALMQRGPQRSGRTAPATMAYQDEEMTEVNLPKDIELEQDKIEDDRLSRQIEFLLRQQRTDSEAEPYPEANPDADADAAAEADVPLANDDLDNFQPYLQAAALFGDRNAPTSDALDNTYVRVIHTNGVHHLAMVACRCRGSANVPLDLLAGGFMPASFDNIKTLFSTAVLDYFRLCNLELKASAYQFYQLIRRMTRPLAPASVANLYHELRRMSRLWRWMKKLKWAGYGHNNKDATNPDAGELANFCPACPQPGINLDDGWLADAANPVYRRTFVADGNFKADHISQKGVDIWLYDGGGMAPKQQDYFDFLKTAIESSTVRLYLLPMPMPMPIWLLESTMRKHIQSNYCGYGRLKIMRQDGNCCYCLCKTRLLLSELNGGSFQGRTTEKC